MPHFFCHPQGLVDPGAKVGARTRVWAFAHLTAGCEVGEDCNICDHTFLERGVRIGNRVTVKCGVYLWDGLEIEDDVFLGPNATFTNDLRPRSKRKPEAYLPTRVLTGCSIGAGAIILPGLTIGKWAMVAAGAVVTRSVPDYALVKGNPAKQTAWVCACGEKLPLMAATVTCICGKRFRKKPGQSAIEPYGT